MAPAAQTLFLLAGTPSNHAPQTYPVTLYTTGHDHALKLVRVIVPAKKGLYGVAYDLEGRVYVAYPHIVPTAVSVIHMQKPSIVNEVGFNANSLLAMDNFFAASAGQNHASCALYLAWATRPPSNHDTLLISVSDRSSAFGARIEKNEWDQLKSLRYGGCPGGPTLCSGPEVRVARGQVLIREGTSLVPIAAGLRSTSDMKGSERFRIVAASPRFFIIRPDYTPKTLASGAVRTTPMVVLDKTRQTWNTVTVPANVPRSRLLGVWLATIVEDYNPDNILIAGTNGGIPAADNNPGHENERADATVLLPSVRMWYATFEGNGSLIPGTLILDNLVDGRRITIHNGQEDSEILDVRKDGVVLFRVNDEIFSAQIEGNKLSTPTLVVKGDDVPEVHWAFWSNAMVKTQPPARPPAGR